MFLLLVLLAGPGWLHAGADPHKTFLHTTVPEKISSLGANKGPEKNVAYIITIEGKPYFIHLKKQSFLPSTFVIYSYDKDDVQHSKPLLVQMDCNYNGYVAGFPNSLVTLNTCSGLRGIVQFKNTSYGIEPLEALSGFVHMIYEETSDNTNIPLLGDNDTFAWFNDLPYQARKGSQRTEFTKLFPRYLEMAIVVDKDLFDYMGSDIKTVTQKVIQIIGLVNTMLTQLKLTVMISSIEIWSNKNKISTTGHPNNLLLRFSDWNDRHLKPKHHITYLFVFRKHPTFIGTTFPGRICDNNYAVGVALYTDGLSLESFTAIIVQLLGLNLGLTYDNTDICYCSGDVCTMTPKAVHSRGIKDFSTCSLDDFKYLASQNELHCLQNNIIDIPVYKQKRGMCGNGVLEDIEQCDCGTRSNCTHKKCCDPMLCTLKGKAACGSGECCTQDCKLRKANDICRKTVDDECDFTEYCNGTYPHCMPDTFVRNGHSCDLGSGFCFDGICKSFDRQCENLIGKGSKGGSFPCFEEINSRSDRFGNCGRGFCQFHNMLCGKLVCTWPHKTLINQKNLSVIYAHVRGDTCVSTFLPRMKPAGEPDRSEDTYVKDGSMCGPDMYCLNHQCLEVRFIMNAALCDRYTTCSDHGVCNNFNHCHCKKGFVPPECQPQKDAFGSIDDGHTIKTPKSSLERRQGAHQKSKFQLIFYISVPVLIITTAALIKQKRVRELCNREESESERSVSEESNSSSNLSTIESNSF
ncbi:disintegrin and metalloproteinase domain-containing protein 5-like isoform X2 [Microcebus murinus]|uniref:disintegrin and metalloproteinase domain-containing protein 5-like isoform X2 n=1 Tax=Microcebus murinus TaxID=30608 RepID=UPI000643AAB0|nr:disintegrin and metalloproteinase domain-containing protein 5-like isoform X2 [Microcebus murinus]